VERDITSKNTLLFYFAGVVLKISQVLDIIWSEEVLIQPELKIEDNPDQNMAQNAQKKLKLILKVT
jgi:hypothetical protein